MADLLTEYLPNLDLRTTVPGAAGAVTPGALAPGVAQVSQFQNPGFLKGLDPELIARLLNARAARNAPQSAPQSAPQWAPQSAPLTLRAAQGAAHEERRPVSMPTLGSAPKKKEPIFRSVPDPFANPYHKMATGQDIPRVNERFIEGVGWEFDGVDPRRASGGGAGRIEDNTQQVAFKEALSDDRMARLTAQQDQNRSQYNSSDRGGESPARKFKSGGHPHGLTSPRLLTMPSGGRR